MKLKNCDLKDVANYGVDNEDGIEYGKFYVLFYGNNAVVFSICRTAPHQACIYEVAMNRKSWVLKLPLHPEPISSSLVITENNTPNKSNFWVETDPKYGGRLILFVDKGMPLYNYKVGVGYYYAYSLQEIAPGCALRELYFG